MLLCIVLGKVCLYTLCPFTHQVFAFDHCFWSMDESNVPKYAGESQMRRQRKLNPVRHEGLLMFVLAVSQGSSLHTKLVLASCK